MEQINDFFKKLEALFLDKDKEAFEEIKEDILHEVNERLSEGETYEQIIQSLGKPKDIAEAYYEDKRLDKAMKAEQDIIDRNDLEREYKLKRREKLVKNKQKLKSIFSIMGRSLLLLTSIFFLFVTIIYLIQEHTVVWGPMMASIFFISLFLFYSKFASKKRNKIIVYLLGLTSLIASIILFATNSWLYYGELLSETFTLEKNALKNMKIKSAKPVDINVILIPEEEKPKIEVTGYLTKKEKKELLNTTNNYTELTVGKNFIVDCFDWAKPVEITLYFPEKTVQEKGDFQLKNGEINLNHVNIKKLTISMNEGQVRSTDINSKTMNLKSEYADVFIRHFFSEIEVNNKHGKSIISDGQGDIKATSKTGLINVNQIVGNNVKLENQEGKNIIS